MDLREYIQTRQELVNRFLKDHLNRRGDVPFSYLRESMSYSLFAGGKRVRPVMVMAACHAAGGDETIAVPFGAAIEMIHTFSLIHDDLPAMDDDDYRRGRLTNHKVYGEAHAILAGDALLAEAFGVLSARRFYPPISADAGLRIMREVAEATGLYGMVGGQSLDLLSENKPIDPDILHLTHLCKTARYIACAAAVGGILADGPDAKVECLRDYGEKVGLAFQIVDDNLNESGDEAVMGKAAGSDARRGKATFPALLGLEASRKKARQYAEDAVASIAGFDEKADILRELAKYVVERDR